MFNVVLSLSGGVLHEHVPIAVLVFDPGFSQVQPRVLEWYADRSSAAVLPLKLTEAVVVEAKAQAIITIARIGFL